MAWIDVLKAVIQNTLARTGYAVMNVERMEIRLAEKMEAITRLFCKAEGFAAPPDDKRARLLALLQGTTVSEALFIVKYLHFAMDVDGDVCEFGVAQGATSALLANEIRSTSRHIWLFDSFAGLPEPTEEDDFVDKRAWIGAMRNPRYQVEKRLRDIEFSQDRVHIVAGFFPDSAKLRAPTRICFAYVDFDLYRPIYDALKFVDERMPKGGRVVVDDYSHPQFRGARKAVDEFVTEAAFEISVPEYEKFAVLTKR